MQLSERYELTEELGRGGMATVHRARDARHARDVAVKTMLPSVAESIGAERFLREIEIVAGLQHPHIVPVFDSGDADGTLFFVMPLIEGESLRARLDREGRLSVEESIRLVRETADALEYAHNQGIVHRDLKPENILQSRGHALLADFGIARLDAKDDRPQLTQAGSSLGTPAYMEFSKVRGGTATDLAPLDVAEKEARALIALVPDAPYGHALLGFVGYERGELKEAAMHLRRAVELDPVDTDVLFILTITLQAAGQIEPAQEISRHFHDVDPLSPFSGAMLCCSEWFSGNIGKHVDAIERSLALDPENPIIHWALGYTYALMGRFSDAALHAQWMVAHTPELPYTAQIASLLDAAEGRREAALATLARANLPVLDAHQTFHISESYAMAGDTARALTLLEYAVDHGMYPYRFYQDFCPFMAPLRGMSEFERIVAKAKQRVAAFDA